MAIANFSFMPNYRRATRATFVAIVLVTLSACNSLQSRNEVQVVHRYGQPESTPAPVKRNEKSQPPMAQVPPVPLMPPAQVPTPPVPLGKDVPKVGVILGPGGMKTYAELGVLREMAHQRIPIQAVVGLEWGAVIGGLYAAQGQINEAEWKSFKLKEGELPTQSFISSRIKSAQISDLQDFFATTLAGTTVEKNRVDFACPAALNHSDRTVWQTHGSMQEVVAKCLPYPPLYAENGGWMASPFAIDEAASWLRSRGANVIVLVNVIGQGEFWPAKAGSDLPVETLLWSELRRELARAKAPSVNHLISFKTSGHPMTDFDGRRALMEAGQKASVDPLNKMVSEYGF